MLQCPGWNHIRENPINSQHFHPSAAEQAHTSMVSWRALGEPGLLLFFCSNKCLLSLLPGCYQRGSNGESEFSLSLTVTRASLSHDVSGWPMGGYNGAALTLLRDISRGSLGSQKFLCHPVITRKCPGRYK